MPIGLRGHGVFQLDKRLVRQMTGQDGACNRSFMCSSGEVDKVRRMNEGSNSEGECDEVEWLAPAEISSAAIGLSGRTPRFGSRRLK
jgi:hypothetical protein